MDLSKVLMELRQELERLDAAILSMERLGEEGPKRGRPPKLLSDIRQNVAAGGAVRKRAGERGQRNS
jgi:hypothetical protein